MGEGIVWQFIRFVGAVIRFTGTMGRSAFKVFLEDDDNWSLVIGTIVIFGSCFLLAVLT